jgi:hypothetical protein
LQAPIGGDLSTPRSMRSKKPSGGSLRSYLREIERDGGSAAYMRILGERLNSADLRRMEVEEAQGLARRQAEHAPRDVRER